MIKFGKITRFRFFVPELLSISDNKTYVKTLVDNILKRDIEQRYKIAYKAAFERLAHHLLNISPTIVIPKTLAEVFHFKSEHTAKNYVEHLKQAYLLIGVEKYSQKSKVRVVQEKVYAVDVAMMNQRDNAFAGDNLGHRLETIVLIHLVRKCKMDDLDVYYLNERYGECDFVVCKETLWFKPYRCHTTSWPKKHEKGKLEGFCLPPDKQDVPIFFLTDHESATIEKDGCQIKVQPVYEWCLDLGL